MLIFLADVNKTDLDQELLVKLDQASSISEINYVITSGYRVGINGADRGIVNGPHMTHKAVDIRCHDSITRFKIIYGLCKVGFKRIGIGQIHIHADVCADDKPQNVAWLELTDNIPS